MQKRTQSRATGASTLLLAAFAVAIQPFMSLSAYAVGQSSVDNIAFKNATPTILVDGSLNFDIELRQGTTPQSLGATGSLKLSSDSPTGTFDKAGATSTYTINSNWTAKRNIVYKNQTAGKYTITAVLSSSGLATPLQQTYSVEVQAPGASFVDPQTRYVKANEQTNLAVVKLASDNKASAVRAKLDGPQVISDVAATQDASGDWAIAQALPPGAYEVSAEYKLGDYWYPVTGLARVYSIDTPTITYLQPSDAAIFGPSDSPVRLKINDEFTQFTRVVVTIADKQYDIPRSACDTRSDSQYILCDITQSPTWQPLGSGSYVPSAVSYTTASTTSAVTQGPAFRVDGQAPSISSFTPVAGGVSGRTLTVSAVAADDTAVKEVTFFITAPEGDGTCKAGGSIVEQVATATGGRYATTFSTNLNGVYCVGVMASDIVGTTSQPSFQKVMFDTTAPVVRIVSAPTTINTGTAAVVSGEVSKPGAIVTLTYGTFTVTMASDRFGRWQHTLPASLPSGPYQLKASATDSLQNTSLAGSAASEVFIVIRPSLGVVKAAATDTGGLKPIVRQLTQPFDAARGISSPSNLAVRNAPVADQATQNIQEKSEESNQLALVEPTASGWRILGVLWYWWMLGIVAGVVLYYAVRRLRQRATS